MGKIVTIAEALDMVGTEFNYYFSDGDYIKAYIKKFDPAIGLTCINLETSTARGWNGNSAVKREDDGAWCLVGYNFQESPESLEKALKVFTEIKETGNYVTKVGVGLIGPSCSFGR